MAAGEFSPPRREAGFEPLTGSLPASPTVPDRHIFRVGSDGAARPTGTTAPREPSRAIQPVRDAKPPAVEPPPPSLRMPESEPAKTKPARRRRTSAAGKGVAGELEAAVVPALPAPAEAPKPRRTRKAAAEAAPEAVAEAKPKRTRKKAETAATGDGAVKKPAARKRKTPAAASSKKKA